MKTIGLDLGPNSIGWTVLDKEKEIIYGSGSRTFPEGVNIDAKSKAESSKNEKRREYRMKRRQLARRKFRNNLLQKALKEAGLMPEKVAETDSFWQPCPYQLRSKALSELLSLHEFGRAIFHLNQRRGFKSNRKSGNSEEGVMQKGGNGKTGINDTLEEWQAGGFRTFGAYLASLDPTEQRLRNRYTLRDWYQQEFEQIWQEQQKYYPQVLTDDLKEKLASPDAGIMYYQRPLKSQKHTIGKCTLEPKKPRCPVSHPDFEEFRMWQIINNLEISGPGRYKELLDDEERTKIVELFYSKDTVKVTDIRKKLKLTEDYTFNYEKDESFKGNETTFKLSKLFGAEIWNTFTDEDKTQNGSKNKEKTTSKLDIWHLIFMAEDPDWFEKYAIEKWQFTDKQLNQLRRTHLKEGYASLSLKAIRKMLPFLRQGEKYDKAAKLAGYHHSMVSSYAENQEELGEPKNLRNPIVQQALFELRTLVNQLIKEYGKPAVIRVELARDLKISAKKRADIRFEQLKSRKRNDEAYQELMKLGLSRPGRNDIDKYNLWLECNHKCPYTGAEINFSDLFLNGRFDIEHILPYSRTLDDSLANKTLCAKNFNIDKGNKTPFELLTGNPALYQQVLDRVQKFNIANGKAKSAKLRKFLLEKLDDDFAQKQLNDTRYISKEAYAYLKSLGVKVSVTTGSTTAPLRHYWGLNSILSETKNQKTRDDHRHHAVDAIVVALTTQGMLQEMSKWNRMDRSVPLHNFPMPWETFYRDARIAVENILVSQKKKSKTVSVWNKKIKIKDGTIVTQRQVSPRGQLHKETVYGKRQDNFGNEFFAVRKNLTDLTPAMISKIVDKCVRDIVRARLFEKGANPDAKKFEIPKDAFTEPLYMPNKKGGRPNKILKVRIRENSNGMVKLKQDKNQWVEPGNNHHVALYKDENGKIYEQVVTFYEAIERQKQGQAIFRLVDENGNNLVQTLQINDMFLLGLREEEIDWQSAHLNRLVSPYLYRVQKLSSKDYYFRKHNAATIENQYEEIRLRSINAWENQIPIKVKISPIGKIHKV